MVFSYNWLQSFFQKKLPPADKLADILVKHSFEVAEVKKSGGDYFLDIEIMPNRAEDCFSHYGIAREISVLIKAKLKKLETKGPVFKGAKSKDFIAIEVKNKEACLRYTARAVVGVKVGPSPKWLRERLETCGLNSINNIVDIANYVMLETGQPLHAFDGEKLEGGKLIVRAARDRERIVTLDEQRFDLNPEILVIADAKNPVAIAGIKGGKLPEISDKTQTVILESANFNPKVIRRASKKLNLKTDASLRFEHGVDPNLTEVAVNRAAYLIQKVAEGKLAEGIVDIYPKKTYPRKMKLDLEYLTRLLGVKIPVKEVRYILTGLGLEVKGNFNLTVPTFRQDILIQEDVIEEVGRVYGYEKIPADFPVFSLAPAERNEEIFWENMAKDILKESGFTEVYNYSFVGEREAEKLFFQEKDLIELENPISKEQKYLRPSLIPGLLNNVEKNQKHFKTVEIFELGKIFGKREERVLSGIISGDAFYRAKGLVDALLHKMGISDIWYDDYQATPEKSKISIWHLKKSAEIKIGNEEIGFLGELSPRVLQSFKVSGKVVAFDIDFEKLQRLASEEQEYKPLSKFPSAVRDLALLVPRQTKVEEVLNSMNIAGGAMVRDIDLFDIYEGEELPDGQKNLAFHIIYQSDSKTLNSKEVDEIHQKIVKALEKNLGWQVRA